MEDSSVKNKNLSAIDPAGPAYSYDDLFPELPESFPSALWNSASNNIIRVVTQVFCISFEERKMNSVQKFGEGETMRICQSIMKDTGAHIDISSDNDKSLTFVLTGRTSELLDARRKILLHYQNQTSKQIYIPKEHHQWVFGKMDEIEDNTATKISVPNISEESEIITISGSEEGIEKAEHEILTTSDEKSKKAFERVHVPKMYHPFVFGAFGERVKHLAEETGVRINVPPASVMKEEITITGEKEGVATAKSVIEGIHRDMKEICSSVCFEVPEAQYNFLIEAQGSTIQEILKLSGVAVEITASDIANYGTITLRGPTDKLSDALSMVYEKANSIWSIQIDAPAWIHKYIIARKGDISKFSSTYPNVHVEFVENRIKIEGPAAQVQKVREQLDAMVKNCFQRLTFVDMTVNQIHYKHIIGEDRFNINRLKEELDITIYIKEQDAQVRIRIEGTIEGVRKAVKDLKEQVDKLEKEKNVIIDITQETPFIQEVPIFKQLHNYIIGKEGANIKRICDETQTKMYLPFEEDKNEKIVISGKKENVFEARDRILKIQTELVPIRGPKEEIVAELDSDLGVEEWVRLNDEWSLRVRTNEHFQNENNEITLFPSKFRPQTGGYKVIVDPPFKCYQFILNHNFTIEIDMATMWYIFKNGSARHLSLEISPETTDEIKYKGLMLMLEQRGINCKFNLFILNITVLICNYNNVREIANLPATYNLILSGGGNGKLAADHIPRFIDKQCATETYQNMITDGYLTSVKHLGVVSIGVMDSGCKPLSHFAQFRSHLLPKMFDATAVVPNYGEYFDKYSQAHEENGHGTRVVEILAKYLHPGSKIMVSNVTSSDGKTVNSDSLAIALKECRISGVDIINCSIAGPFHRKVVKELNLVQNAGIIVVAAAGNEGFDRIYSDFENGRTIIVGSHDENNAISMFSNGKCCATICALGEQVKSKLFSDHQDGTSFATAHMSALVGHYFALVPRLSEQRQREKIVGKLLNSAHLLTYDCNYHRKQTIYTKKIKMNSRGFLELSPLDIEIEKSPKTRKRKYSETVDEKFKAQCTTSKVSNIKE